MKALNEEEEKESRKPSDCPGKREENAGCFQPTWSVCYAPVRCGEVVFHGDKKKKSKKKSKKKENSPVVSLKTRISFAFILERVACFELSCHVF